MLSKVQFNALLASRKALIIDGALATELEQRGYDLHHPLWSGRVLRDDANAIEKIHLAYYLAGADIAITASYQASTQGLMDHFDISEHEAQNLIRRSVELAQNARAEAYRHGVESKNRLLIAGSVGPFGAYLADGSEYRGDYVRSQREFQDFHRPRIQALLDAGVDLLAFETMPNSSEIKALLSLLSEEFPDAIAWLGCTIQDPSHLSDGTSWVDIIELIRSHQDHVVAVGVNCVPLHSVIHTLEHLSRITTLPLLCYPNSGEVWDASTKMWQSTETHQDLCSANVGADEHGRQSSHTATSWLSSGARLIGGCCRTGPAFIHSLYIGLNTDKATGINVETRSARLEALQSGL